MFNWLFKKKPAPVAAPAAPSAPVPAVRPSPADAAAAQAARAAAWAPRLAAAAGDDAALLALARDAEAPVDVKVAAVEGLVAEAALKEAERAFRTHDRRVHRLAKQRLAEATATRVAREAAALLLARAEALEAESVIPANRLVALDREWRALDAHRLAPGMAERFAAVTAQLTATMHDRAEREASLGRWTGEARAAAAHLQTVALAVAQGVEARDALTAAADSAAAVQVRRPEGHADAPLDEALNAGRLLASQVEARLALLGEAEALPPVATRAARGARPSAPDPLPADRGAEVARPDGLLDDGGDGRAAGAAAVAGAPSVEALDAQAAQGDEAAPAGEAEAPAPAPAPHPGTDRTSAAATAIATTTTTTATTPAPAPEAPWPFAPAPASAGDAATDAASVGTTATATADPTPPPPPIPALAHEAPWPFAPADALPEDLAGPAGSALDHLATAGVPAEPPGAGPQGPAVTAVAAAPSSAVVAPPADNAATAHHAPVAPAVPLATGGPAPAVDPAGEHAVERWRALPPVADPRVGQALEQRWSAWWRARRPAPPPKAPVVRPDAAKPARARPTAPDPEAVARADALLAQAEAALGEGHLADAHRHLTALDAQATPGQRGRLQALWAEHARLKGWQQWGGSRAREDLVAEAEALAAATAVPDTKVNTRTQADAIEALRRRWKELDRLGGPAGQPLWQRFDAALQAAYVPVAEAQARLDADRQANLAAREALLATLEATPEPDTTGWRDQVRALDTFQTAWRKLGPVEHTVPHKAREALVGRWRAAVQRVEAPLGVARQAAEAEREQLIARAHALATDGAGRDTVARVRELQAEWQEHAKAVPLARGAENALWARFKAETDAVFARRDAEFNARDESLRTHLMAAEALIARLAALDADTPAGDVRRALAEVDAAWRQGGDVPRAEQARLAAAYRDAREGAAGLLAAGTRRQWQATLDAVRARRDLCAERERSGPSDALDAAWAGLAPVPPAWSKALGERWRRGEARPADPAVDDWLLQLEMALDIPSPPAFEDARRNWKLRAMKAALESRAASPSTVGVDDGVARLLGEASLAPAQADRLEAVLDALRTRPR